MFPAHDEDAKPTVEEEEALRRLLHLAYAGDEPKVDETFAAVTRRNSIGSTILPRVRATAITVMRTTIGRAALAAALSALVVGIAAATGIAVWWMVPCGAVLAIAMDALVRRLAASYYEPYAAIVRRSTSSEPAGRGQLSADLSLLRSQSLRWIRRHDAVVATALVCAPALALSGNDAAPAVVAGGLTAGPALGVLMYCEAQLRHHRRRRPTPDTPPSSTASAVGGVTDHGRGVTRPEPLPDAVRTLPPDHWPPHIPIPHQRDRGSQRVEDTTGSSNGNKQESQTG